MDDAMASDLFSARYWNEAVSIAAGSGAHQLGSGGLFIATDAAPEKGSLLDFELTVGEEPPVVGIVEVVEARRADEATGDRPAGMRIKFVHLEDEAHARDVLGRMVVAQTASLPPPPAIEIDSPPAPVVESGRKSKAKKKEPRNEAIWDNAVALEEDFFERAAREPVIVPDDEVAEALSRRMIEPAYLERRARLRRTFMGVVALASVLAAATAIRGVSEQRATSSATSTPAADSPSPVPARDPAPVGPASQPAPVTPSAVSAAPAAAVAPAAEPSAAAAPAPVAKAPAAAPEPIAHAAQVRPPPARTRKAAPPSRPAAPAPHKPAKPAKTGAPAHGGDSIYD